MRPAPNETSESLWRLIFAPLVWAAHFLLSYVSAAIACAKFAQAPDGMTTVRVLIVLYTLVALALIVASARSHWRRHRAGGLTQPPHDAGSRADRHRFLSLAGLLLCALSAVAVLYTAAVAVLIQSCA